VTDALAGAYLVSFATTGDPNGAGRPTWPRHQPVQDKTVDASASAARTTPSTPRPSLWLAALDEAGAPVEAAEAKSPK
jgi:carboxylesterase type B